MTSSWQSFSTPEAAARACAGKIAGLLDDALTARDSAALAVSGGSTAKALFEELAALRIRWERVHLFWADERAVPSDHPMSNYRLAAECLLLPARVPRDSVHRIHGELAPEAAARTYVDEIRRHFGLAPGEIPRFDVLHLGMGADAHTASLFPGQPWIDDRNGIAAAVSAAKPAQWRVSLLPGVLLAARHAVFLVTGASKAASVRAVFQEPYNPATYPAQLLRGHPVTWFLDDAAASLLA